jgi:condensin complex subunit 1
MSKLLDSLLSGFAAQAEQTAHDVEHEDAQTTMSHRTPMEIYAFLLQWFVSAAENIREGGDEDVPIAPPKARRGRGGKSGTGRVVSGKKGESWTWTDHIPSTLALISKVLRLKIQRVWTTSAERDVIIGYVPFQLNQSNSFIYFQGALHGLPIMLWNLRPT